MKKLAIAITLIALTLVAAACGSLNGSTATDTGKTIKSATISNSLAGALSTANNNVTVTLSNKDGVLKSGENEFLLTLKDASGKPIEVTGVAVKFYMPAMGTMPAMTDTATFTTTGKPGVCQGKVTLEASGEWQVQVSYEGPSGNGKTTFSVTAQ